MTDVLQLSPIFERGVGAMGGGRVGLAVADGLCLEVGSGRCSLVRVPKKARAGARGSLDPLWTCAVDLGQTWCVAFAPDGKTVAASGSGVVVCPVDTRRLTYHREHSSDVVFCAFSPDGRSLASCSWDHSIVVRSTAASAGPAQNLVGHTDCASLFSPPPSVLDPLSTLM